MELKSVTVNVGDHAIRLRVPADPDGALRDAVAREQAGEAGDPYWSLLWKAAAPTARFVLEHSWPENSLAIELGCGVGLVGIAGLQAGLRLTFTDHIEEAVRLAVQNAALNGFPGAAGRVLDWSDPGRSHTDVLLASDVLYDSSKHATLLFAASQLLTEQGSVWIGDPGREAARQFLQLASRLWTIRLFAEDGRVLWQPQRGHFHMIELRRRERL